MYKKILFLISVLFFFRIGYEIYEFYYDINDISVLKNEIQNNKNIIIIDYNQKNKIQSFLKSSLEPVSLHFEKNILIEKFELPKSNLLDEQISKELLSNSLYAKIEHITEIPITLYFYKKIWNLDLFLNIFYNSFVWLLSLIIIITLFLFITFLLIKTFKYIKKNIEIYIAKSRYKENINL